MKKLSLFGKIFLIVLLLMIIISLSRIVTETATLITNIIGGVSLIISLSFFILNMLAERWADKIEQRNSEIDTEFESNKNKGKKVNISYKEFYSLMKKGFCMTDTEGLIELEKQNGDN